MRINENAPLADRAHSKKKSITILSEPPVERFLSRLEKTKETGHRKWIACCPAHDDRNPSLTITEGDDGTVLVKCWAGCPFHAVVHATGLEESDMFPPRPNMYRRALKPHERWVPRDVLRCLADKSRVVMFAASDILTGRELTHADLMEVCRAYEDFYAAATAVGAQDK